MDQDTPALPQSDPHRRNELIETILGRRSFRGPYADKRVSDDVIASIVSCGLAAPSSKNARPWRLHVVTDRELLRKLAAMAATAAGADTYVPTDPDSGQPRHDWPSTVAESASTLRDAPLAIFIENNGSFSGGRSRLASAPIEFLEQNLFTYSLEVLGVGSAIANMWLAALAQGASAAFVADICVAEREISKALGIKCDLIGALLVGYDARQQKPPGAKFDLTDPTQVTWHRASTTPTFPT